MAVVLQQFESSDKAEQKVWRGLITLSDEFFLMQELSLNHSFINDDEDEEEKRPDFVVVGADIGVVILEVKHWDLRNNTYEVFDQRRFRKLPERKLVPNPWYKARVYRYDIEELLSYKVPVTSLIVFPRLTRAAFLDAVGDPEKLVSDPQTRMLASPALTVFSDDIDMGGWERILRDHSSRIHSKIGLSEDLVRSAIDTLLPSEFRIGGGIRRKDEVRQLLVLSERQQEAAFKIPSGKHFLFDIAGSGKTNILLSRAIHFARRASKKKRDIRILLTSHSATLCQSLELILRDKLRGADRAMLDYIEIRDLPSVLRDIMCDGLSLSPAEYAALLRDSEEDLAKEFEKVAAKAGDRFMRYDVILIDEIQDCDRWTRPVVDLIFRGEDLFMVGDVAQQLRPFNVPVHRFGLDAERSRIDSDFVSYRCPAPISAMAHRFAWTCPSLRQQLQEHDYPADIRDITRGLDKPPDTRYVIDEIEALSAISSAVSTEINNGVPLDQIMVVSGRPTEVRDTLRGCGIPAVLEPSEHAAITCVDFDSSKGLEAEVVLVTDVESLPVTRNGDEDDVLSRCRVYVAITRAQRRLIWIYYNTRHRLVSDLLKECRTALTTFAK